MSVIKQPFTNLQLELLKVFAHKVSEEELLQIRSFLADFFAKKAIAAANKSWDEKGWTDETVDQLLNTKLRTPYDKK